MEINATIHVNLENGKTLLVLIMDSLKEQYMLYEYISQNRELFRKIISDADEKVDFITTGCVNYPNSWDWEPDYISLR